MLQGIWIRVYEEVRNYALGSRFRSFLASVYLVVELVRLWRKSVLGTGSGVDAIDQLSYAS